MYEIGGDDEPEEIEPSDASGEIEVDLDSPNGPKIAYPDDALAAAVDAAVPEGWEVDYDTTPADCGRGRKARRAP